MLEMRFVGVECTASRRLPSFYCFRATDCGPWGQEGDSIIGEIADLNLSASAKTHVAALIGQNECITGINFQLGGRYSRRQTGNLHNPYPSSSSAKIFVNRR